MLKLAFTPMAQTDLESIGDYIAKDDPVQALAFINKIQKKCIQISHNPKAHPLRPEISQEIRSCPLQKYVIFFTEENSTLVIIRILHGAMDIKR